MPERETLGLRQPQALSVRKLAEARGLPASTLWRALGVYQLWRRHPELARFAHVGVGHVSVVLAIDVEHQFWLLQKTETLRWSKVQLRRACAQLASRARPTATAPCARPESGTAQESNAKEM